MISTQLLFRGIWDNRVLEAMRKVKRHRFVEDRKEKSAYDDGPLDIGEGQTISQPYMVALMTECLELTGNERILEIGTGSGYQTAILAEIAAKVYTIERFQTLSEKSAERLTEEGYVNIEFLVGDGTLGWEERAPFDGAIVTAGAPDLPERIMGQLVEGGKLVVPIGSRYHQTLFVVSRRGDGYKKKSVTGCVFVPLIGEEGWGK